MKPYYASLFLTEIRKKVEDTINNLGYIKKDELYRLFDLSYSLNPVEFYVELPRIFQDNKESTMRVTFRIETNVEIEEVSAAFSAAGLKMKIGIIKTAVLLSIYRMGYSKASVNYVYKPLDLIITKKGEFEIKDLSLSRGIIDTSVDLKDIEANTFHNVTDSLILNKKYDLTIRVAKVSSSLFKTRKIKLTGFKVVVSCDQIEITEKKGSILEDDISNDEITEKALEQIYDLNSIYLETKGNLESFLKLFKLSKAAGLTNEHVIKLLLLSNNDIQSIEQKCQDLKREEAAITAKNLDAAGTFQQLSKDISEISKILDKHRSSCKEE